MAQYEWKRFWYPHGDTYSLAQDGYLPDPDGEYGRRVNPQLAAIEDYRSIPCLVMLGEPGVGKSTEFAAESRHCATDVEGTGDRALFIDLKEYQSDGTLVSDAFENQTVQDWISGSHNLHLFFDSLDEGRIEIRNIGSILSGRLRRLQQHAARLRLRIACRTADWPSALENTLREIWGRDTVSVIELAPLRRIDIATAVALEKIDPEQFISDVSAKRAQPFACTPITLRFLIEIYRQAGTLPSTEYELYEQGCSWLCEEFSQSRLDAGYVGQLTSAQRLALASRIAAAVVYCGRATINLGVAVQSADEAIRVPELSGDFELTKTDRFDVEEDAVREVLSTALFSGKGPKSFGFSHRTYAEFLAARYLICRNLDETQFSYLLFHAHDAGRVIPQLSETAAWIATQVDAVFEKIMKNDPQVLLRSDVATADVGTKKRLTQSLLDGFDTDLLDDSDWSLHEQYRKLNHTTLVTLLEPIISDKNRKFLTRRFALQVAIACRAESLLDLMISVALDSTDDEEVRREACRFVITLDNPDSLRKLIPLAVGNTAADPRDTLRGITLTALWPKRILSAQELFTSLQFPKAQNFIGEYRNFLSRILPASIAVEDLPDALKWCSTLARTPRPLSDFSDAAEAILQLTVTNIERNDVRDALVDYVVLQLNAQESLGFSRDDFDTVSEAKRRELVELVVPRLSDLSKCLFGLTVGRPMLIREGDLRWLLEKACAGTADQEKHAWTVLARCLFVNSEVKDVDHVLELCQSHSMIAKAFEDLFHEVELNSDLARTQRLNYERRLQFEAEDKEELPPLVDPSPSEQVENSLVRCEAGDITAWCDLNRALQLEPRSTHYRHDHNDDLTTFPGWSTADSVTKDRILTCAQEYIQRFASRATRFHGSRHIYHSDLDGYRALVLLQLLNPVFLDSLHPDRWSNLIPVIFAFPISSAFGTDSEERQQHLIALAYRNAPDSMRDMMIKIIEDESSEPDCKYLYILRRIESCFDDFMLEVLSNKSKDGSLAAAPLGDLLGVLLIQGKTDALTFGLTLVGQRSDPSSSQRAEQVAAVLWRHSPKESWDTLWPEFCADRQFFRNVILAPSIAGPLSWNGPRELTEDRLGELYILLSQEFPMKDDPVIDHTSFSSPSDNAREYRNGILTILKNRANLAACAAIEKLITALPEKEYLNWIARDCKRLMLQSTWMPLSVSQLRALTRHRASRLVRNERDLQKVALESIARLQKSLKGETPAARDLWDNWGADWKPIDENAFSDYVKRFLALDLKNCGIVALREVEIRRGYVGSGQRTDIYVSATVEGPDPGAVETKWIIVEAKGCWHPDLKTAMETQLRDRYLKDNDCQHGIYLIGWFPRDQWAQTDSRRGSALAWNLADATTFFKTQATGLSSSTCFLEPVLLDASLP